MMLGTQHSGVTISAATLQNAGFIRCGRGVITILDRSGLEGASCECYEVAREQFGGLLRSVNEKKALNRAASANGSLRPRGSRT